MDSLFADFMAVIGRFFEERLTALADERAALVVPRAREGLAAQAGVDALTRRVADLETSLPAAVKPLATKAALADAVRPLATTAALNAAIEPLAAKSALTPLATKTETTAAIASAVSAAVAPLATREQVETAKQQAITAATNGRPNYTAMRNEIAAAITPLAVKADVDARLAEIIARLDALTPPPAPSVES